MLCAVNGSAPSRQWEHCTVVSALLPLEGQACPNQRLDLPDTSGDSHLGICTRLPEAPQHTTPRPLPLSVVHTCHTPAAARLSKRASGRTREPEPSALSMPSPCCGLGSTHRVPPSPQGLPSLPGGLLCGETYQGSNSCNSGGLGLCPGACIAGATWRASPGEVGEREGLLS